jgi:hypothetical protein
MAKVEIKTLDYMTIREICRYKFKQDGSFVAAMPTIGIVVFLY